MIQNFSVIYAMSVFISVRDSIEHIIIVARRKKDCGREEQLEFGEGVLGAEGIF